VVLRAVRDACVTEQRTPQHARRSAREFLADEGVQTMFSMALSIPEAVWEMTGEKGGEA